MKLLSKKDFYQQLDAHQEWLGSEGIGGKQLNIKECRINLSDEPLTQSLKKARFNDCYIEGLNIKDADVSGLKIMFSTLKRSSISNSNLASMDLSYSHVVNTIFVGCDLRGADLRSISAEGFEIQYSDFKDVDLSFTNLNGIELYQNVNFDELKDLTYCTGDNVHIYTLILGTHISYTSKLVAIENATLTMDEFFSLTSKDIKDLFYPTTVKKWDYLFPIIKLALDHFPITKQE